MMDSLPFSPKAVCFDMDGVLLDTEHLGGEILKEAAELQGCTLNEAQWKSLIGVNMKTTREALNSYFPGRIDPERFISDWCRIMLAHIHRDGVPFKPHATELLIALRRHGLKLALCTSNAADVVAQYLDLAGWENAFDHVITGEMVHEGKPAPDIYLLGAERLGVRPDQCVGVEDSVNGVKALRAAGLFSVMIPDILPYHDGLAPYVDMLLKDLGQLETLLLAAKGA